MCKKLAFLMSFVLVVGLVGKTLADNKLLNGSFEQPGIDQPPTHWTYEGPSSRVVKCSTQDPQEGNYTARSRIVDYSTDEPDANLYQEVPVDVAGWRIINLSGYVKRNVLDADFNNQEDWGRVTVTLSADDSPTPFWSQTWQADNTWHYFEPFLPEPVYVQQFITVNINWGTTAGVGTKFIDAMLADVFFLDESLCHAHDPDPNDGAEGVPVEVVLSWKPGIYAADVNGHDVYLGTDFNDVNDANVDNPLGVYKGCYDVNSYDPDPDLEFGKTYYWRIDEVNDPCIWKGDVWSFKTFTLVVEDFESYTDTYCPTPPDPNYLLCVWEDRIGSEWGYAYLRQSPDYPVHGGAQSMLFCYYTKVDPYYSAVRRTYDTAQDWTVYNIKALELWFRGEEDNGDERLYVALEDEAGNRAEVEHPDPNLQSEDWIRWWQIDLQDFNDINDVNLASIKKISIGLGDGESPGGAGFVYFDDIRLYPPRCIPENRPAGDVTGDCVVDFRDLAVLAGDWLENTIFP